MTPNLHAAMLAGNHSIQQEKESQKLDQAAAHI